MLEKREPTHMLTLRVPINIPVETKLDPPVDVVQDALRILISVSRLAAAGAICGDPDVEITGLPPKID